MAYRLKEANLASSLVMLHTHIGSQVTDVRKIRVAVREAAQVYTQLAAFGITPTYLNLGGGLAVDYDGSKTTFHASANYGLREYAEALVYAVMETCDEADAPHPVIVTESGRALTAHHAVVVAPVVDVIGPTLDLAPLPPLPDDPHTLVRDMQELLQEITVKTYRQVYNEAVSNKDTMHQLFDLGYLTLVERAHVERMHGTILQRIAKVVANLEYVPEELEGLSTRLADTYVANFSLFQTLPDHWAIGALFPILPLTRLNERPTRHATLADISCDSDGRITKFIDLRDVADTLPLHPLRDEEPYLLGFFLTGAYQDVLANSHNLFGRVAEAHVRLHDDGTIEVERYVGGQKARRVIENMGYETDELLDWLGQEIDEAARHGVPLTPQAEADLRELYGNELVGYTYLE